MSLTPIQHFYKDKTIFLTGGTGFLGNGIIEKLLRSCYIKKIYVLIREKKGVVEEERLRKILSTPYYDRAKKVTPDYNDRIEIVKGDLAKENLGVSDEIIEKLKNEIEIVIHCAATTRFNEPLRIATQMNTIALKCLIDLSKEFRNLKSFVHVSTCYTNCVQENEAFEKFYPPPRDPLELIEYVKNTSDEVLAVKQSELLQGYPNTYTFTKSIGEDLIRREAGNMPMCIVRPAISNTGCPFFEAHHWDLGNYKRYEVVMGCQNEPIPGWGGDNLFGPYGIMVGVASGVLRIIYADQEITLDLIPVDMTANAILAAGYKVAVEPKKDTVDIYHVASGKQNPISLHDFIHLTFSYAYSISTSRMVWVPMILVANRKYAFMFINFFLHTIPGYIFDAILRLLGKKPMMVKIYDKLAKTQDALQFFMRKKWIFHDDNTKEMYEALTENDKKLFNFDIKKMEWEIYLLYNCRHTRISLMNDPMSTLRKGINTYKIFNFINTLFVCMLLYLVYYLFRTFVY